MVRCLLFLNLNSNAVTRRLAHLKISLERRREGVVSDQENWASCGAKPRSWRQVGGAQDQGRMFVFILYKIFQMLYIHT